MSDSERKDFKPWAIAIAYNLQEGSCLKCSKPLGKYFHKHHKDGDHSNNSVENLELLCASCHSGEAYKTHIEQKKQALGNVEALINKAIKGEVSGAATEKAIEAIKLQLSLIEQCYPAELEELPVEIRTRNYLMGSGLLLKEYEKGVREGIKLGVKIEIESILPYILKSIQLEGLVKRLMSKGVDKDKQQGKE